MNQFAKPSDLLKALEGITQLEQLYQHLLKTISSNVSNNPALDAIENMDLTNEQGTAAGIGTLCGLLSSLPIDDRASLAVCVARYLVQYALGSECEGIYRIMQRDNAMAAQEVN